MNRRTLTGFVLIVALAMFCLIYFGERTPRAPRTDATMTVTVSEPGPSKVAAQASSLAAPRVDPTRPSRSSPAGADDLRLPPHALAQIEAVRAFKGTLTDTERKVDSQILLSVLWKKKHPLFGQLPDLRPALVLEADGRATVDIQAAITPELARAVEAGGGTIVNAVPQHEHMRAKLTPELALSLAARRDVSRIALALPELHSKAPAHGAAPRAVQPRSGTVTSEGDSAHGANLARAQFGINGAGIKVAVLSDGVDALAASQSSSNLPSVTVLSGQAGTGDEGTAMLEIVHDVAPGAALFFATASGGKPVMAANIDALAAAGCKVIIDDITYLNEAVFEDDVVSEAVSRFVASGGLYFSSAANSGNLNDGTSGVWEGNFVPGGPRTGPDGQGYTNVHLFAPMVEINPLPLGTSVATLQWSDPMGASNNDYDVYALNAMFNVFAAGFNSQDGNDDPFEGVQNIPSGSGLVVDRFSGETRYLHLNTHRGRLQTATSGSTFGHNAAEAGFCMAATDAAIGGGSLFTSSRSVETFSSDGFRRIFFEPNGAPITPGNFLATGGRVLNKPTLTAADNVSTAAPGFSTFPGTSAAAPHAGALAALVWSFNPSLSGSQVSNALWSSAIDIETVGVDRDSGNGIIMAVPAVQLVTNLMAGTTGLGTTGAATSAGATGATTGGTGLGGTTTGTTGTTGATTAAHATTAGTTTAGAGTGATAGGTAGSGTGTVTAGGATAGGTGAGTQTSGGSGVDGPDLLSDWSITVKRPKNGAQLKAKSTGIGTVRGFVQTEDLDRGSTDVDVEVAVIPERAFGTTNAPPIEWNGADKVGKVSKKGRAKFVAKSVGQDADLESGEDYELLVRATDDSGFDTAVTETNSVEFSVK